MRHRIFAALLAAGLTGVGAAAGQTVSSTASAPPPSPPSTSLAPSTDLITPADIAEMRGWLQVPVTVLTLRDLNTEQSDLDARAIEALDQRWRAERAQVGDRPLIAELMARPLSNYLIRRQAMSGGLYTEIFVMSRQGLNAGQSSITSDYWQGDEAKFQKTYPVGPDAVFVDAPEFHAESGTWRAQVNLALADPDSGRALGAVTVEVNLTELARRRDPGA